MKLDHFHTKSLLDVPRRPPGKHARARGGGEQGHEDGRLAHLPLLHHQRENEQQSVGPLPRDAASARDARQVGLSSPHVAHPLSCRCSLGDCDTLL